MLLEMVKWLMDDVAYPVWDFLRKSGYFGMAVILLPLVRKLVSLMKQFTN